MKLFIITGNPGKAEQIKKWLNIPNDIIVEHKDIDIPEIKDPSIETVAYHKALEVAKIFKEPFIVEDTGFFLEEYKDFPGAFTKSIFYAIGYEGLLKLAEKNNKAYFKSVIAYIDPTLKEPKIFTGVCKGHIITDIDNKAMKGLPHDNFFIREGETRRNSELSFEELKIGHHRANAVQQFSDFLNNI